MTEPRDTKPTDPGVSSSGAPGAAPPPPPAASTGAERFYAWVRGLGVVRADGWLGGVCAGIAARLRIDPVIVRGIVAVAAVLGFPMLLLYAIAWVLLPDAGGRIHVRELLRGRFDPAIVGIAILLVVSFVPVIPWLGSLLAPAGWGLGWAAWSPLGFLGALLGLALVVGVVYLVARSSGRAPTPGDPAPAPRRASADAGDPGAAAATVGSGAAAASSPAEGDVFPPSAEPIPPARGAGNAEIAEWRARHDAWRAQNDAWRRQQQDAERHAREQERREREAIGAAFAAEANEHRRVQRLSNPRTSFAYVVATLGAALVVGAVATLASAGPFAGAIGLFSAGLVLAFAMVIAGVLRRRSGFLAFIAVLLLFGGTTAAVVPQIAATDMTVRNRDGVAGPIAQSWGTLWLDLTPTADGSPPPIVIDKGTGSTMIEVFPGVELDLEAAVGTSQISWRWWNGVQGGPMQTEALIPDDDGVVHARLSYPNAPVEFRQTVMLRQDSGSVLIDVVAPSSGLPSTPEPSPVPTPTAFPSPVPTDVPSPEVIP